MSQLYFNPRCSKCRQALALLQAHGIEPQLITYLEQAPGIEQLTALLAQLGLADARAMMRKGETEYSALDLDNPAHTQAALIATLAENPNLIERPIFVQAGKAVIARPPEKILAFIQRPDNPA